MIHILSSSGQECFFHGCLGKLALPLIPVFDFAAVRFLWYIPPQATPNSLSLNEYSLPAAVVLADLYLLPLMKSMTWTMRWLKNSSNRVFSVQVPCCERSLQCCGWHLNVICWSLLLLWRSKLQKSEEKGAEVYRLEVTLLCVDGFLQGQMLN